MVPNKVIAPSCLRNQNPILDVLKLYIPEREYKIFELGTGTGQHGVFFTQNFPNLKWFPSDCLENHSQIENWVKDSAAISKVLEYEIGKTSLPDIEVDALFTANTFHIISQELIKKFIIEVGDLATVPEKIFIYGPFKYGGHFTSSSNRDFSTGLTASDPLMGIRDFESICRQFAAIRFELLMDHEMPANNKILVFKRTK